MENAMISPKIRAFLDSDVLLAYLTGKAELQALFSQEVRERAVFAINGVVLQELLLAREAEPGSIDLSQVVPFLEVVGAGVDIYSPEIQTALRHLRNYVAHANDVFILAGASSCDVLLTYDKKLMGVSEAADVRSETPEEFLDELGVAA
jgi:predicted nucleic acid-binding protein